MGIGSFIMNRMGFADECSSADSDCCDVEIKDGQMIGNPYASFGNTKTVLSPAELGMAYEKISCVASSVDAISNNMQMIEPVFWDNDKREVLQYSADAKLKAFRRLLERPNANDNRKTFISKSVKNYTLFGAVYYAFILDSQKNIISIKIIDECNVSVFVDASNSKVDNYTISNAGIYSGKYVNTGSYYTCIDDENKILAPYTNSSAVQQCLPASILQGSGIESLMYWFGCVHNQSLLSNGARPSIIFLIKSLLNKKHREQLRNEIRVRHSGAGNAGNAIIIDGAADKDIKQFSQNNKDMEFTSALKAAENAVYKRLGTNWILGEGIEGKDLQKGMEVFYDMTVCPMFQGIFNHIFDVFKYLTSKYQDTSVFYLEQDIPALLPRFMTVMKDMPNLGIFTVKERRKKYNYPPLGDDRDDELTVQSVKVTQSGASGVNETGFTEN